MKNPFKLRESHSAMRLAVSFIISLLFFFICLFLIDSLTAEEIMEQAVIALKKVPCNMKITEYNVEEYFALMEVPVQMLPEGVLQDLWATIGGFSTRELEKNSIVTSGSIESKADRKQEVIKPVETAVGVSHISQMAGGIIREGDLVNISRVRTIPSGDNSSGRIICEMLAEKAYVTGAFSGSGVRISSYDTETAATVINIILAEEEEESLYAALEDGTVRVSKVW